LRAARSIPHPLGWGGRPQFDLGGIINSKDYLIQDKNKKISKRNYFRIKHV